MERELACLNRDGMCSRLLVGITLIEVVAAQLPTVFAENSGCTGLVGMRSHAKARERWKMLLGTGEDTVR